MPKKLLQGAISRAGATHLSLLPSDNDVSKRLKLLPRSAISSNGLRIVFAFKPDKKSKPFFEWFSAHRDAIDKTGRAPDGREPADWVPQIAHCAKVLDPSPTGLSGVPTPFEAHVYDFDVKEYQLATCVVAYPWVLPFAERLYARQMRKGRRKRGRRGPYKGKPLTNRQLEALERVAECKGNIAEAARQLGVDRKTVKQHVDAGLTKLSLSLPQYLRDHKPGKTVKQPTDARGQETLASDDQGPAAPRNSDGLPIAHEARMKIRRARPS